ncbi:MAG TPA: glycerol-3-phosphate 1-O-acyltransferase PlsY [Caulobacteraceae bacterium]|jgi:glycerol-3-phosphate acyltransferase PlsY
MRNLLFADWSGAAHDHFWPALALTAALAYLLGSIPFGVLITRAAGVGDVRNIGSGNIGATNVLRTGRKDLALLTLLLDGGKGGLAVFLARWFLLDLGERDVFEAVAGGAAFLGHLFPVWLKFKGGKGVATFFGVLLVAAWPVGLAAGAIWIGMAAAFRYSSLAALTAAALSPWLAVLFSRAVMEPPLVVHARAVMYLAAFMAALIVVRHRANIARLRRGEEPRIGGKKA